MTALNFAPPKPRGVPRKYPWYSLKIGDSFYVEGRTGAFMHTVAPKHFKIRVKTVICRGVIGTRVWRIA